MRGDLVHRKESVEDILKKICILCCTSDGERLTVFAKGKENYEVYEQASSAEAGVTSRAFG